MGKIKVLIATGIYPPEVGGPATYAKLMHDRLGEFGFETEVLPFRSVRHLPRWIRHFAYFLKVLKGGKGKDIIFTQDTVSTGFPAMAAAKVLRKFFVIRVPGDYAWEQAVQRFGVKEGIDEFQNKKYGFKIGLFRFLQKTVVKNADTVITPSQYFKNLVSSWGVKPEKIHTIYNGISLIREAESKNDTRKKLGIAHDEKVLISVGRLVPWKGFEMLIELISELDHTWKLYIVGDGPDREILQKMVNELAVEKKIMFTGGISREEVFLYYDAGDVFVLNTSFESFSFQIVEAMNCGIPVVTTNIGNLSEIIADGKEGFLLTPNDKAAFKGTVEKLVSDQELRKSIVTNARTKVQNFSIEKTLTEVAELLKLLS